MMFRNFHSLPYWSPASLGSMNGTRPNFVLSSMLLVSIARGPDYMYLSVLTVCPYRTQYRGPSLIRTAWDLNFLIKF